jgi:uncharacterized membrane-anchored protein YitT (DUF2179 family)
MYTGEERPILLCVVSRAEVVPLKTIVHEVDPQSFVIIGQAQEAFGLRKNSRKDAKFAKIPFATLT